MTYESIDDLRAQLAGGSKMEQLLKDPAYRAKQLHDLPPAKTVDRVKFILDHCRGKRVLEFGASGPLHDAIRSVAGGYFGIDRQGDGDVVGAFDLDDVSQSSLPVWGVRQEGEHSVELLPDVIICGEVIEHLSNPGWFLTRLKKCYQGVPVIITVPNAYAANSQSWLKRGIENVNRDHVAWYSPMVLATLLNRAGYTYADLFYYNGQGPTAEGLVVVTE